MINTPRRLVPDELWELFQRVVPEAPKRRQGGGRRRHGDREVLAAIVFVATSGCTWQQLPACGIAAGPLFLATGAVQGLARDGFDFTRNAISQLSLGDLGWIQVTSFLLTGALALAGASGIRHMLADTIEGRWAPRLIRVFGASFLLAAVFTADPGAGFPVGAPEAPATSLSWHGALHMLSAMVGFLALGASFLMLARHFAALRQRGWVLGSRLVPLGILAGFAASSATVPAFTAGAAREAVERGIAAFVSAPTVRRWPAQDALKPWQHRSWIFITDPDFRTRAGRVLDLYARTFDGVALGADEAASAARDRA